MLCHAGKGNALAAFSTVLVLGRVSNRLLWRWSPKFISVLVIKRATHHKVLCLGVPPVSMCVNIM